MTRVADGIEHALRLVAPLVPGLPPASFEATLPPGPADVTR